MTENAALSSASYEELESTDFRDRYWGLTAQAWGKISVITVLMVALFWPNLRRLFFKVVPYWGEANWQHSFLIPIIGLYYLYLNREELLHPRPQKEMSARGKGFAFWVETQSVLWGILFFVKQYYASPFNSATVRIAVYSSLIAIAVASLALIWWLTGAGAYTMRRGGARAGLRSLVVRGAETSSTWFGLYCLLWAMIFYAWSIWPGQNDFFKDVSMVVTLFGVVLMLCGWRTMKIAWFPIVFLLCAIPWPGLVYSWVALPLQKLAASAASWTLKATGVEAVRSGTKLIIGEGVKRRALDVAEACAGLKSLMTFVSLGAAIAFLSSRHLWQKLIISASAVPIAIFCNMMRVTGQGLMDHYVSQQWSEGFAHMFFGLLMLIPAFFLILLVAWVLDNLFIEEADKRLLVARGQKQAKPSLVIEAPTASAKLAPALSAPRPAAAPAQAVRKAAAPQPAPAPRAAAAPAANDLAAVTQRLTAARAPKRIAAPAARPAPAGSKPAPREGKP